MKIFYSDRYEGRYKGYTKAYNGKITDTTYQTVKTQLEQTIKAGYKPISRQIVTKRIMPLSEKLAVATFIFKEEMLTPKLDTMKYGGNWTFVFKKFEGEWKAVHEVGSIN